MRLLSRMSILCLLVSLAGCYANNRCPEYNEIPLGDINGNGVSDYRYQIIGDSILAYNEIICSSVGHHIGHDTNERVLTRATTGAKVHEIEDQFRPPEATDADFDFVFVNGGLNDLIADTKVLAPDETPCDCNSDASNHEACLEEIDDVTGRMESVIETIQSQSQSDIALIAYYPAERLDSFIGECFPYVEQLHDQYRQIAAADPKIHFVETYGAGVPIIQKVQNLGLDNYHPDKFGSEQIAKQVVQQLDLVPQDPE